MLKLFDSLTLKSWLGDKKYEEYIQTNCLFTLFLAFEFWDLIRPQYIFIFAENRIEIDIIKYRYREYQNKRSRNTKRKLKIANSLFYLYF